MCYALGGVFYRHTFGRGEVLHHDGAMEETNSKLLYCWLIFDFGNLATIVNDKLGNQSPASDNPIITLLTW
jgi:hypothetical protein